MKVLVAGAGIGGLVSAGKLAELGLEVEVLEKRREMKCNEMN